MIGSPPHQHPQSVSPLGLVLSNEARQGSSTDYEMLWSDNEYMLWSDGQYMMFSEVTEES